MLKFRAFKEEDWSAIAAIFQEGIETKNATFDLEVPSWESWDKAHLPICRIAAEKEGQILAWAALSPISSRSVFQGVAELSLYVSSAYSGQKIGTQLLAKLISESENHGIWTLESRIFPENKASIKIHEDQAFRKVGYRECIGQMNGIWRDILVLERRSKVLPN